MAAVMVTIQTTAAAKAGGERGGEMTNDDRGTGLVVLPKSWSDVEGRVRSIDDVRMDAARGAVLR